ncbi:MAG: hypothetical protein MI741_22660 [Rhodospirillales bacterium]|nr:hypothetical protein [Rhodospirillales bacterium]
MADNQEKNEPLDHNIWGVFVETNTKPAVFQVFKTFCFCRPAMASNLENALEFPFLVEKISEKLAIRESRASGFRGKEAGKNPSSDGRQAGIGHPSRRSRTV